MRNKRFRIIILSCLLLALSFCGIVYMVYMGILIPNKLIYIRNDDIIGCDVSRYQGEIQWGKLSDQGISFTFIKATEGSSYIDPNFKANWEQAAQTELYIGAYHFFSFESPGTSQAKHYSSIVENKDKMLPPVIDVEFYGSYREENIDPEVIRAELNQFISIIREEYGVYPIIYTTQEAYRFFIDGYYEDCPLWIRSILTPPRINREWTFWQYTNRERLEGYNGDEPYIDMNVFCGDEQMLKNMLVNNEYKK